MGFWTGFFTHAVLSGGEKETVKEKVVVKEYVNLPPFDELYKERTGKVLLCPCCGSAEMNDRSDWVRKTLIEAGENPSGHPRDIVSNTATYTMYFPSRVVHCNECGYLMSFRDENL